MKVYKMEGVNSYMAYYNIGVIHECLGNVDKARVYYNRCGKYEPALARLRDMSQTNENFKIPILQVILFTILDSVTRFLMYLPQNADKYNGMNILIIYADDWFLKEQIYAIM